MSLKLITQEAPLPPAGLIGTAYGLESYAEGLWTYLVIVVLSTICLGIFTALVFFSTIVLIRKGVNRLPTIILLTVVSTMYASAIMHWTTQLLNAIGYYNIVRAYSTQLHCQCILSSTWTFDSATSWQDTCTNLSYSLPGTLRALTQCAPTIILAVNVILGDAVVWWRVWAIWPGSLLVRAACLVLLTATFSMGLFDVNDSCSTSAFVPLMYYNLSHVPSGTLFQKDLFGLTASVLSLATNFIATVLIWTKAWEHRQLIASVSLGRSSRVEKVLALLVESGAVYCVLWVSVVASQVLWQIYGNAVSPRTKMILSAFDYFIRGCLIPLVGIYPTSIILLVALNKSHFSGTSLGDGNEGGVSLPHISFRQVKTDCDTSGFHSGSIDDDELVLPRRRQPLRGTTQFTMLQQDSEQSR